MAGSARSSTTASEHRSAHSLRFADWPLSGNRDGRYGHRVRSDDRPLPGSEIQLAAYWQRILEGDSRIGALTGPSIDWYG
jgi:hypothetical protein